MLNYANVRNCLAVTALVVSLAPAPAIAAPATPTQVVVAFDFRNATVGATTANASYSGALTTNAQWVTGGTNGFEDFSAYNLGNAPASVTRDFGPNTPSLTFTTGQNFQTSKLSFVTIQNHNYTYSASYKVGIYLDGSTTPLKAFIANAANGLAFKTIPLPYLAAGTHTITWAPVSKSVDTGGDYFGLMFVAVTTP